MRRLIDCPSKVSSPASAYSVRSSRSACATGASCGPVTRNTLPRLAISTPRRSSICRRCASNGPARLARRSLSAGSRVKSHWWGLGMGASVARGRVGANRGGWRRCCKFTCRSEEHTSELQSLMRISYAVFCLKKKNKKDTRHAISSQPPQHHGVTLARVTIHHRRTYHECLGTSVDLSRPDDHLPHHTHITVAHKSELQSLITTSNTVVY